jgi:hypothetical protein
MYSVGKTHLFSLDVETDDLYGETFAFGVSIWDLKTKQIVSYLGGFAELEEVASPWCRGNIIPLISKKHRDEFVKFQTRKEMRDAFWRFYMQYREKAIILADFQHLENAFFRQCVREDLKEREWLGPYPMMDLGTMLAVANLDPDIDRFIYTGFNNLVKHNPIHDAHVAGKTYFMINDIMDELFNRTSLHEY